MKLVNRCKGRMREVFSTAIFRMVLIVCVAVIPLNLLTLILVNTSIREAKAQVAMEHQAALELYMSQIDNALSRMFLKMNHLALSDADFARLNTKEIDTRSEYYNQMQSVVNLKSEVDDILEDNALIDGAFALFPQKDILYVNTDQGYYEQSFRLALLAEAQNGAALRTPKWYLTRLEGRSCLLFVSSFKNAYYGAWIELEQLAYTMGFQQKSGQRGVRAFANRAGTVFCSNDPALEQLDMERAEQTVGEATYTMVFAASEHADLVAVQMLSKNEVSSAFPSVIRTLMLLSALSLLALPAIMVVLIRHIARPMSRLTAALEQGESGDMVLRIQGDNVGAEFDVLNRNFNRMLDEIAQLKIQAYEEQIAAQKIKMQFLSQQIQPHFILNALNILYSYEQEEYPLIQKMIMCLSRYFRYVVNANAEFVVLEEEMEHIQNYFEIQQARYQTTFLAEVSFDEAVARCLVPPLLIQNFAENAIKHSLTLEELVRISVTAQLTEDGRVHIRISDDGEGIPEEILEKIKRFRETGESQEGLGVGIQNAIERTRILYKQEAELQFRRREPRGTQVDLLLPFRERSEEDERDFD